MRMRYGITQRELRKPKRQRQMQTQDPKKAKTVLFHFNN